MPDTKSPSQSPGANCTVTSNTWKSLHLRWALRWDWWISLGPAGGVGRVELMWQRPTGLPYETLGLSKGSGWFNCGKLAGNMSRLVILNLKNTRNSESEPSTYIHLHDFGFNMLGFHGYTLRLKLTVAPPLNISRILKKELTHLQTTDFQVLWLFVLGRNGAEFFDDAADISDLSAIQLFFLGEVVQRTNDPFFANRKFG